jgi:hypothetical protein
VEEAAAEVLEAAQELRAPDQQACEAAKDVMALLSASPIKLLPCLLMRTREAHMHNKITKTLH